MKIRTVCLRCSDLRSLDLSLLCVKLAGVIALDGTLHSTYGLVVRYWLSVILIDENSAGLSRALTAEHNDRLKQAPTKGRLRQHPKVFCVHIYMQILT